MTQIGNVATRRDKSRRHMKRRNKNIFGDKVRTDTHENGRDSETKEEAIQKTESLIDSEIRTKDAQQ